MPRRRTLALLMAAMAATASAAVPAAARADSRSIARGLARDPVYVAPHSRPGLSVAERGAVRLRILRRDIGRIRFAVVPSAEADDAGGVAPLANAVDRRLRRRGATVLVAGHSAYVVVSYPDAEGAAAALRRAFRVHVTDPLGAQLLASVDGLARADPGPRGDIGSPGRSSPGAGATPAPFRGFGDPSNIVRHVEDTFRLAGLVIALAIALPFLIVAGFLLRGMLRRRSDEADSLALDRAQADAQISSLGDDIRALDLDVSMPGADPAGVQSYSRALDGYERGERAAEVADTRVKMRAALAVLSEARRQMDAAREALSRPPVPGTPPAAAQHATHSAANRALGRPGE